MNRIEFKLDRTRLSALFELSQFYLLCYEPVGTAGLLTKTLLWEVQDRMEGMLRNWEQKKFTVKLTKAQSITFFSFWMTVDLSSHPYEMIIVNAIIEAITKANIYERAFSAANL